VLRVTLLCIHKTVSATNTFNTAVGQSAGYAVTTGVNNTLIGGLAGDSLSDADFNVAVGFNALGGDTLGSRSTAIGYGALLAQNFLTAVDNYNTAVGFNAGVAVTTGWQNTIVGGLAGDAMTSGDVNTFIGYQAAGDGIVTGARNTAVGGNSGLDLTSGASNTLIGNNAGQGVTTGANNICLGYQAGYGAGVGGSNLVTGNSNIYIGAIAHPSGAGNTTEIVIGYNSAGKGTNTGFINAGGGGNYQGNNSSAWSTVSDRRLKKNIVDSTIGLAEINQLQVRNFEYLTADEITELPTASAVGRVGVQLGVIAQEIQAVLPNCVKEESTGVLSVDPDNLTWHLIKAVQELSAKNDALEARIATLEG
jgi:hypothetical protein